MMIFSLLYASTSLVPPGDAEAEVDALVAVSRARNATMNVTGCLIFGGGRFAQILEGEQAAVEDLMRSILRDPRHTDIAVLEQRTIAARRFAGWALGYAGPSLFVQRTIAKPVAAALDDSKRGVADLIHIMTSFRAQQFDAPR